MKRNNKGVLRIIIVGGGKVGKALTQQLVFEGHDVTIVDTNTRVVQDITEPNDIMGIVGSGASMSILEEAGVAAADILIAVTGSDELNMLCCILARKTGQNIATIARVRNPDYAAELSYLRQQLGLSMIINPELEAAKEIARLLSRPQARHVSSFARGHAELVRFRIPQNNVLCGKNLIQLAKLFPFGCLFGPVERDGVIYIPDGSFTLHEGDDITIISSTRDVHRIFEVLNMCHHAVGSCMIIGGSKASYYLATLLEAQDMDIKVIEKDSARCEQLSTLLPHTTILCGDGADEAMLKESGIESVEAFVPLTGQDEENILLTLYAKSIPGIKTITKINRTTFTATINDLALGSVVYPKRIASESILSYVRARQNTIGNNVETLYHMFDDRVEALEFQIGADAPVVGIPLMELKLKSNLLIACISRQGKIIFPRGGDSIESGDTVIVITTHAGFNNISDILR